MGEPNNKPRAIFEDFLSSKYIWNDFSKYKIIENGFIPVIRLLDRHKIKEAKKLLVPMLSTSKTDQCIHLYNFLALCHFYSLEYQECEYYIKKGQQAAQGREYLHFLQCGFFIQRRAEIPGPISLINMVKPNLNSSERPVKYLFENKLFLEGILENTPYRHIKQFREFVTEEQFTEYIGKIRNHYRDYSILSIYLWMDNLWIYDLFCIRRVNLDWKQVLAEFDDLMAKNKEVLSIVAVSDQEKRDWWKARIELDRKLGSLIRKVASAFGGREHNKIIFVLDEWTIRFPFEQVFNKVAYRTRSLEALYLNSVKETKDKAAPRSTIKSSFYLLDADNNLPRTRECISNYMGGLTVSLKIEGAAGRPLSEDEQLKLAKQDLFMYFGHGSGRKHFSLKNVRPWITFLFGCSSCRLICAPNFTYNGTLLAHLGKGRVVLGMLWDVTDKDLDQFTISFLECFLESGDIGSALYNNLGKFRLRYLNGAAVVAYGCVDPVFLS
ncbi:hypothetical protein PAEPH01_2002 [Pancytospora epiphaga]|nr:hypothetical protein PAEPH01_2002 [Pancytospora epiphaga]